MRARRIECACGCGAWFYWTPAFHRPPAYVNPEHYARERNRRARMRWARDRKPEISIPGSTVAGEVT